MTGPAGVGFGFRKSDRLRKTDEFSSVFAFRRRLRSEHFELAWRPAVAAPSARLGVVVAKRHAPTAVARNLIKRIARETFRQLRPQLPPNDVVLRLTKSIERADRKAVRGEIEVLLRRLRGT